MRTTIDVELGERSYPIHIGTGLLAEAGACCVERGLSGRCLVVSDSRVDPIYGDRCGASLAEAGFDGARAVVPAGEPSKSADCLGTLYDTALAHGLDRSSFVVALGGGVVGDLAGYMAATYLRGLRCVQVPTTVVAMVDSAVGGKTGINLPQGKNLVGSYWQPAVVLADLATLDTLPEREYLSGLAEVIKYGVIWDRAFFELVEGRVDEVRGRDAALLAEIVGRSCAIKAAVVQADEREGGLRAILNFGHTVGHAIEKVAEYGTYLHGEAIAVGMVYAARLSHAAGGFSGEEAARIATLVAACGLPLAAPDCEWEALRRAIGVDKKTIGSVPRFVLAEELGKVRFRCEVAEEMMEEVWHGLGQ